MKVFVGADTREPPGAADCPLVHIFMGAKTAGMDAENLSHTFGIGVEIYDESFVEVEGKDNLVEVAGIERVEQLRKLVETAVAAVIPSGTFLTVLEIEYEPVEFFPFFLAGMEITMEVPCFRAWTPLNKERTGSHGEQFKAKNLSRHCPH